MKVYPTLRDFYQDYGWVQGYFFTNAENKQCRKHQATKCCLSGAVRLIATQYSNNDFEYNEIESWIRIEMYKRIRQQTQLNIGIPDYNDVHLKTKEQMLEVMGDIPIEKIVNTVKARNKCASDAFL